MKRYLMDTSALLTLRDNEPGADEVAELLQRSRQGKNICFICFISLMETLVHKDPEFLSLDLPQLKLSPL